MEPQKPEEAGKEEIPGCILSLFDFMLLGVGGFITLAFTVPLTAQIFSRIEGGRPGSMGMGALMFWLAFGAGPLGFRKLIRPPVERPSRRKLSGYSGMVLVMTSLFLLVGADNAFGPRNWHGLFRREKSPPNLAENLKATCITPHLETALGRGTNVLWCGTFQLAWNAACDLTGGDLHFDRDEPMVAALNLHAFTSNSLDTASYVAMAGFVRDHIHEQILSEVGDKFHDTFKPRAIPSKALTPRAQDIVAYACLYKLLTFPVPFERLDESLVSGGVKVRAFGLGRPYKPSHDAMYPQMVVYDYQNENDFVLELKAKQAGDRIFLAKVSPQGTLSNTVARVRERIAQKPGEAAVTNDVFIAPRINLDLTREYTELENHLLIPAAANIARDLVLQRAVQWTRFEMNEKGVELRSEANMAFGCAADKSMPDIKHIMVFDKPFLIMMERTGAPMPYFALWIDNPELLTPW
jgi:hypothetical protein